VSRFEVRQVSEAAIPGVFRSQLPALQRAMRHGAGDALRLEDMLKDVLMGKSSLWAVLEGDSPQPVAFLVLSVHQYPAKRTLFIEALAGSRMDEWIDVVEPLLRDAKLLLGVDTVEASCRLGLAKRLAKRAGWRRKAVLMEFN
jgi:hypothetical protein